MLVNLQLLVNFGLIPCSRSHDCYFNMAMGLDSAVGNIWSANRPFLLSETELRRTQLNEAGSTETQHTYNICCRGGKRDWCPRSTAHKFYTDSHPSRYQPCPRVLNFLTTRTCANRTRCRVWAVLFGPTNYEQCLHLSEWVTHMHIHICVSTSLKKPISRRSVCSSAAKKPVLDHSIRMLYALNNY